MSDVTYSRKADALSEVDPDGVSERLALAQVHATQAVSRALREVDGKLKYVADKISEAVRPGEHPERWITWGPEWQRIAVAVHRIESFSENRDGTLLTLIGGHEVQIPVPYGTVAWMVGAS